MSILKEGVSYAGLGDVFGGQMWYVHTPNGAMWHTTKREAMATIRREWSHDKAMKRAIMAQLTERRGRAWCNL